MCISQINEPIPGMFVLCWMHLSWWFQIWPWNSTILTFFTKFVKFLTCRLHSPAAVEALKFHIALSKMTLPTTIPRWIFWTWRQEYRSIIVIWNQDPCHHQPWTCLTLKPLMYFIPSFVFKHIHGPYDTLDLFPTPKRHVFQTWSRPYVTARTWIASRQHDWS